MASKLKKYATPVIVASTLLVVLLLSFFYYEGSPLLNFINISFYFCSAYIVLGFMFMVVEKGFFDGISYGFRSFFRKSNKGRFEDDSEIEPLSEMLKVPYTPLLASGFIILAFMLAALYFWY